MTPSQAASRSQGVDDGGPLAGTVVLDLSRALAGPHAAMMLADLGAGVILVETPAGDDSRGWGPPFVGPDDQPVSTYFLSANRNKESIRLDLKTDADRSTLAALVAKSDVLVENFRPGVLDRLGFPVDRLAEINPRLVVLSITGFGHDGPEGGRAGYDQIAQGEGGLMSLTGADADSPTKAGVPIGDLLAGMYGAFGVASALAERERTGRGTVVRTSLLAAIVGVHAFQGTRWTVAGEVPKPGGNHHPAIAPYGAFRAADGMIQAACGNDQQWKAFAGCLGMDAEDQRFTTNRARVANREDLIREIEERLSTAPSTHWLDRLAEAGVPAGKIRPLDEVYTWEQTVSQGLLVDVDHPVLGRVQLPGPPLRIESLEGAPSGRARHRPPPLLGEHDDSIRAWAEER